MVFLRSRFIGEDQRHHIKSGQVLLRPPLVSDYEEWAELRSESRQFLEPWEPLWSGQEFSKFNFRARIKHYNQLIRDDQGYPFFVFQNRDGQLLGAVTLANVRRGAAQMCSVGYWIGERHARLGYMGQSLRALSHYAFNSLNLHRIEAACLPDNVASINLLQSSGFSHEGTARKYLKIAGKWQDHLLFARLSGDSR